MRLSFEPAFAGWVSPPELRLGLGLSRHSKKIETLLVSVGSKPGVQHHAHSRVLFLYHKISALNRELLMAVTLKRLLNSKIRDVLLSSVRRSNYLTMGKSDLSFLGKVSFHGYG